MIRPENQTVVVDEEAVFFCQVLGEKGQIWFNKKSITDNPSKRPPGLHPTFVLLLAEQDGLGITNITLTVNASVQRNNSEVICTDQLLGIARGSYAYLTIQGERAIFIEKYCGISATLSCSRRTRGARRGV